MKRQWKELEDTTADKGDRLFDANRHVLYEQSVDDIDGWMKDIESQIVTEDVGHDLTTVNLLVQKQNVLEVSHLYCRARLGVCQSPLLPGSKWQSLLSC